MKRAVRPPLALAGCVVIDADGEEVATIEKVPLTNVKQIGAHVVDEFRHALVNSFNAHGTLVGLVYTVMRELSPLNARAFQPQLDVPRVYAHLRQAMASIPSPNASIPADPAVLELPAPPPGLDATAQAVWTAGFEAGYKAAWQFEQTTEPKDTET